MRYHLALLLALALQAGAQMVVTVATSGPAMLTPATQANLPSVGVARANFVSGQRYTNTTGRVLMAAATIHLTNAAVAGVAWMDLVVEGARTNAVAASSTASSIANWRRLQLFDVVNTNEVYLFTNRSTGTGSGASIVAGSCMLIAQ